jgi:hypothetical protein
MLPLHFSQGDLRMAETVYLMIQNPGVAPEAAFTLFGASNKKNHEFDNPRLIGQFGSGNKHAMLTMLRFQISPIIYAGNLRMEFTTREEFVNDGNREDRHDRVQVKYSGKTPEGKSRSATEDLSIVLNFGSKDWISTDFAIREFVSNALDRAEDENAYKYIRENGTHGVEEYIQNSKPWENVTIEIVNSSQVRAKAGFTRIYIPLTQEVFNFYRNLGKWFLHFSEPELLGKSILKKNNRNLGENSVAVIYRRGVRVREVQNSNVPSLFDYNLENLQLDECRNVDDYRVQSAAGYSIGNAEIDQLKMILLSYSEGNNVWEQGFHFHHMGWLSTQETNDRKEKWKKAFDALFDDKTIFATKDASEIAAKKGYKVLRASEEMIKILDSFGVPTPISMFSQNDKDGIEICEPTSDVLQVVDWIWNLVDHYDMKNSRPYPLVQCFTKMMTNDTILLGFYRKGVIHINMDIAKGRSDQLKKTVLEEIAHYVTEADDFTRTFQEFLLDFGIKMSNQFHSN